MRRFLFFVNAEYCYAIMRPLQKVIRARGDEAAWFVFGCSSAPLKNDELLFTDVSDAAAWNPHAVFSPGDWTPYFLPGAKVQIFHGIARNKRGAATEAESDHYRIRGWFDLYCTHATEDTERFQALSEEIGTFQVVKTGWPKLDPLFCERKLHHAGSTHDHGIPTVFFASTFSPSMTAAPALGDVIEKLVRSGSWRFIVTLHPKMEPQTISRFEKIDHPNYQYLTPGSDLFPWMTKADVMLCDTSSIMYEFMFLDKPVVTFRTRNPGPWLIDVGSPDDIEPALAKAFDRPPTLLESARLLCRELHEFDDGCASERVIDAVDELLSGGIRKLKRKPLNILRKLKLRRKFGYWGPTLKNKDVQ